MPVILADNLDFLNLVRQTFLARRFGKGGLGITNNIVAHTYEFQRFIDKKMKTVDGGDDFVTTAIFKRENNSGYVAEYDQRIGRQVNFTVNGSMPWSCFEMIVTIGELEALKWDSPDRLYAVDQARFEGQMTVTANDWEDEWFDSLGNALLLGTATRTPLAGLKYWITRTGFHVDGTTTVGGIDCLTYKEHLNRYAGPLGNNLNKLFTHKSTAKETFTNGIDIVRWMRKMARWTKFASPGSPKTPIANADDDTKLSKDDQFIYSDEIGVDNLQEIQDARGRGNDNMSPKELATPDPVWNGVPVTFVDGIGVGADGLPTGVHSTGSPNTSRGTVAAGTYANTGEMFFVNSRNFGVVGQKGCTPQVKPAQMVVDQQCSMQITRWMWQSNCTSRMRQGTLWGFNRINAA